jgi:hypothetical protein
VKIVSHAHQWSIRQASQFAKHLDLVQRRRNVQLPLSSNNPAFLDSLISYLCSTNWPNDALRILFASVLAAFECASAADTPGFRKPSPLLVQLAAFLAVLQLAHCARRLPGVLRPHVRHRLVLGPGGYFQRGSAVHLHRLPPGPGGLGHGPGGPQAAAGGAGDSERRPRGKWNQTRGVTIDRSFCDKEAY